jgi:hypothetical protein
MICWPSTMKNGFGGPPANVLYDQKEMDGQTACTEVKFDAISRIWHLLIAILPIRALLLRAEFQSLCFVVEANKLALY